MSRFIKAEYSDEQVKRMSEVKGTFRYLAGEVKFSESDFQIMRDLYDGEVAFADYCVGQITDRLRALGKIDDTVVVVTSDHGENLGEHGLIDHLLSMYETTLHIPLVIRYPESFEAGTAFSGFVSIIDIAATILDLCNICDGPKRFTDRASSLAWGNKPRREFVIAENEHPVNGVKILKSQFPEFDTSTINYRMRAIRTDSHKFIWKIGNGKELYDLQTDPDELHDIADKQPEICNNLLAKLKQWMEQIPSAADTFLESKDVESLKILRSLGYVE